MLWVDTAGYWIYMNLFKVLQHTRRKVALDGEIQGAGSRGTMDAARLCWWTPEMRPAAALTLSGGWRREEPLGAQKEAPCY